MGSLFQGIATHFEEVWTKPYEPMADKILREMMSRARSHIFLCYTSGYDSITGADDPLSLAGMAKKGLDLRLIANPKIIELLPANRISKRQSERYIGNYAVIDADACVVFDEVGRGVFKKDYSLELGAILTERFIQSWNKHPTHLDTKNYSHLNSEALALASQVRHLHAKR